MPVDADQTLPDYSSDGKTRTTPDGKLHTPQRLRIHVPTANAEIVLGLNDDGHQGVRLRTSSDVYRTADSWTPFGTLTVQTNEHVVSKTGVALGVNEYGFVGLLTTVDHGNVYVGAVGAANLGSSYHHTIRVANIVDTTEGLVSTLIQLWSKRYVAGWSQLTQALTLGKVAWAAKDMILAPLSSGVAGGGGSSNFDYMKTGHVFLFGARSVKMQSLEGVSTSAGLFNSMKSGASSAVSSIISSSVSGGAIGSLFGGYSASVSGGMVNLDGIIDTRLSSRVGSTEVRAPTIRIGNPHGIVGLLDPAKEATRDVWVRASDLIEMTVPSSAQLADNPMFPDKGPLKGNEASPVGLQVIQGAGLRLSSEKASVSVMSDAITRVGKTLVRITPNATVLGRTSATELTFQTGHKGLREAYTLAIQANSGVKAQATQMYDRLTKMGILAGIGLAAAGAAVGSAAGAGFGAKAGGRKDDEAGADEGAQTGAVAGAVVGGLAAITATLLVAMRTQGLAQRVAKKAAQKLYTESTKALLKVNEKSAALLDPRSPTVTITKDAVIISSGLVGVPSIIKVSASGIEIKGPKITINDQEYMPPTIPPIPPIPEPPSA